MAAYYNEIDPYAAQWLRNLISAGHIAPGVVDERSIKDVHPDDLREFTQCHFFAGVGVWSYALRLAGWPDDRPVWTGSCPCQPFSAAGQGAGFDDERHLWPDFAWLIQERSPSVVFGEQVASKGADPWVDLVQTDLETMGYAFGAIPFPSAGVGAPHVRDRTYWLADSGSARLLSRSHARVHSRESGSGSRNGELKRPRAVGGLANVHSDGRNQRRISKPPAWNDGAERNSATGGMGYPDGESAGRDAGAAHAAQAQYGSKYGDSDRPRHAGDLLSQRLADAQLQQRPDGEAGIGPIDESGGRDESAAATAGLCGDMRPGPVNGFWADADWLFCRDGKWRPVEPGSFPLVARPSEGLGRVQPGLGRLYGRNRTGRLKGYGNAINAQAAKEFIAAYMETMQ